MVWHNALPAYMSATDNRVGPNTHACLQDNIPPIFIPGSPLLKSLDLHEDRRNELSMRTFDKITKGGPLSKHLAPIRTIAHDYSLRNSTKSWTSF